jgi:molybdate transport system substrate-binding protein
MAMKLNVLSAGAAKGLLNTMAVREGITLAGEFGAVGAMRERVGAGAACDVIVLTDKMIAELVAAGEVVGSSVISLGKVYTGVALLSDAVPVAMTNADDLRALLSGATKLYFPDAALSTAGIHFMKVLTALGLHESHRARFAQFPNGATAMRALADAGDVRAIGVTQCSEILITKGVKWLAPLPGEFALATGYAAGVVARAENAEGAATFLTALAAAANAHVREEAGFL